VKRRHAMRYLLLLCMTLSFVIFGPSSQAAVDEIQSIGGQDEELTAPAIVGEIPADVAADEGPVQYLDEMTAIVPRNPMVSPEVVRRVFYPAAVAAHSTDSYFTLAGMLRSTRWRSTPAWTIREAVPRRT